LPAVDVNEAIRITRKGIEANPTAWRLHQHLGYIYWQQQNYTAAAETYKQGAAIPGVPPWMKAMYAKMVADGGSRSTAREIYSRMYEQSTDDKVKEMAQRRLMQLDALDQLDSLNKFLASFQSRLGRCPASWKELEPVFRGMRVALSDSGAPLDPSGSAYVFGTTNCEVKISPDSKVPVR